MVELLPKTANMFIFNVVAYFMPHLRREAGRFFFYSLVTFITTLNMSCLYRTLASITRTVDQAMVPTSVLSLGMMIYTGFVIPIPYLPDWSRWMNYINPMAYAFEALMISEFEGRQFPCGQFVPSGPGYDRLPSTTRICNAIGALPGTSSVNGETYLDKAYDYKASHKWRSVQS